MKLDRALIIQLLVFIAIVVHALLELLGVAAPCPLP
jgi:hypothetical protein